MLTALFIIIGLSLVIIIHELGHFLASKYFGLRVDEFGIGFPPKLFSFGKGETKYTVNALPFGGFVKIFGESDHMQEEKDAGMQEEEKKRSFAFQAIWKRIVITAAGVVMNLILGWVLLSFVFMVGTPPVLLISEIVAGSPAEEVGLKSGDIIKNYTRSEEFISFVNANKGGEIEFAVMREGKDVAVRARPRAVVGEGEGALGVFLVEGGVPRTNPFLAFVDGARASWEVMKSSVLAFVGLIKNLVVNGSLLEGIVGPVGIVSVANGAGKIGIIYLVQLIAVISLNLAVLNLVPFPALDGGRIAMLLVEKVRRKSVSRKVETVINTAGFILLILLMISVTIRDVGNLF